MSVLRVGKHARKVPKKKKLAYIATAAATLVLATGLSATLSQGYTPWAHAAIGPFTQHQKAIELNTQLLSQPYGFVALDGGIPTTYMPIWYVGKALEAAGITQSWDGASQTWTLSIPSGTAPSGITPNFPIGNGNAKIVVNGQLLKQLNTYVARDPLAGPHAQQTVYMPIYYIQLILRAAGIPSEWDGHTWKLLMPANPASSTSDSGTHELFGFVTHYGNSASSLNDLESHPQVQAFSTFTHSITSTGGLTGTVYTDAESYAALHHLSAYITVNNYDDSLSNFDGTMAQQLLQNPTNSTTLINNIVQLVQGTSFAGVNMDFEMLPSSAGSSYVQFLGTLQQRLHAIGKQLNVDLPGVTRAGSAYNYAAIGKVTDGDIIMAYDYSYPGGPPGAIAPIWWVKQVLDYTVSAIPANQVLLGIPMYGYDWHNGTTTALSLPAIDALIRSQSITPKWDGTDDAPYFTYTSGSITHTVYYENATSIADKLALAKSYNLQGVSLWHMDLENSSVWNAISAYANQP